MIHINENFSLRNLNTFHIDVTTKYYVTIEKASEFPEFFKSKYNEKYPFYILNGGSNVLFTQDFQGYIIKPNIR